MKLQGLAASRSQRGRSPRKKDDQRSQKPDASRKAKVTVSSHCDKHMDTLCFPVVLTPDSQYHSSFNAFHLKGLMVSSDNSKVYSYRHICARLIRVFLEIRISLDKEPFRIFLGFETGRGIISFIDYLGSF